METVTELTAVKTARGSGAAKLDRRLTKLAQTALDSLEEVLTDDSAKAADRISAVKLTFELLARRTAAAPPPEANVLHVHFDGTERALCE